MEQKAGFGVYAAICAVQAELATSGIAKDRKNVQQGYAFRGIDDVFNALAPLLSKHKLCILPRYLSRTTTERVTKAGTVLYSVVVEAEIDFVSVADGSRHSVRIYGEAMDSADKATNKAMSAAYKYAALQVFAIPTESDHDADAATPPETLTRRPPAGAGVLVCPVCRDPRCTGAHAGTPPAAKPAAAGVTCPKCGKRPIESKYPKPGSTHYCGGCKLAFEPGVKTPQAAGGADDPFGDEV